jgi:hypothetical protein
VAKEKNYAGEGEWFGMVGIVMLEYVERTEVTFEKRFGRVAYSGTGREKSGLGFSGGLKNCGSAGLQLRDAGAFSRSGASKPGATEELQRN